MVLFLSLFSLIMAIWDNFMLLGIFLLFFILSFDFMKRRRPWSHYPPGPRPLPFIGTILQIDVKNPHLSFMWLSKKYGNVYSLQNFYTNVVVLNGMETVKEALRHKSEDFADRPDFTLQKHLTGNKHGLVLAKYTSAWKEQRRFTLSVLRDFGMGKKSLEWRVAGETEYLCSAFRSEEGHPFDPHYCINNAVSNVICSITFGNRFDYKEKNFQRLLCLSEETLKNAVGFLPQLLEVVPCLLYIPGLVQKAFGSQIAILDYINEVIKVHKETRDASCRRDIIDAFLEEAEKRKEDEKSKFSDPTLSLIIADLFFAGTGTVANTLLWGLLYLVLHPNVQTKVQEEIDEVICKKRSAKMEDQASLPYTRAVIHEIQRCANVSPVALPHMTYRDTVLQDFFIPKGTTVIFNLTSVLKDETMWEKPYNFYPEHFLDGKGQFVKHEAFLPFSAGLRVCLGEQLARMELFLFFTSLLQHFTFCLPENQPKPQEDGCFSSLLAPHPFQIQAFPR
ncbi:cytochrome P450 2D14-like [Lacerta agilis]|uniref:cytochrome P450 2D14-like n=1 Tax=Lacerta agilis TaxID=80427 RepID=UPI001419F85D|nr:cytochrome P450 2D14-like [Lacerta agilis]